MATPKEQDRIRRELEKVAKAGTATEKTLAQAIFVLNEDLRNISKRLEVLEKKLR